MEHDDRVHALGARVRRLRKAAGLTIEQLAEKANLHPNHVGTIERGKGNPSVEVLLQIADALEMDVSSLLGLHEAHGVKELRQVVRERIRRMSAEELRMVLRVLDAVRGG